MLKSFTNKKILDYCIANGVREHPALAELRQETAKLSNSQMQISPEQGSFLAMIAKLINVKNFLEIGTFTGYSSLWIALACANDAKITTLDLNNRYLDIANKYWQQAKVADKIISVSGRATENLAIMIDDGKTFDMAFIDANKSEYLEYYELCLQLVRPGGLVVIDNVLMYGQVLEETPPKKYVKTLQELNQKLYNDNRVDICMLPLGDGMTLARKKEII